jgi:modulator of FtsH protease
MEHFAKLGSWGELYLMLGTASAALIGLLFVAASLHLREIVSDEIYKIRAQDSMLLLVATLVQATAILMPQPLRLLGIELLAINLWSVSIPVGLLFKATRIKSTNRRGGFSQYRAAFFISGYVAGIAGAIALITGVEAGLYAVTASYVAIVIAIIWNAWNIMLGIGQSERRRTR